ncbi:2-oxo acid dehydrogenase subunit E2 [Alicyclobacillus fastidiosus]|uniref:Dihydrolipoamide acetyltransferase component of pyruvate dehydrogenase complex n=1 Tax=Alicyclobacillus fastidiosus TaxID=392011 RepID=A0ABY6ZEM7_9BACL|nr:dihydrolipoamide acetyltransferase family protein [Alicyclobacillus fastidiosus]WAH41292.1 2-oxo acid dehydrogenase subunit E2 [Alicyclobacillus fastidiosus]GMA62890.1 dihydrolipoamide acetyltransferase component of pyruvate dehydrogenase complex [Alicyclobacillus fastidiosus]
MQAIVMPKLGLTMIEGAVSDWLKQPGDNVSAGEAIAEIETEKITYTLEAPADGTLLRILLPAGESAPVTETIAWIGEPGEEVPDVEGESSAIHVSTNRARNIDERLQTQGTIGQSTDTAGTLPAARMLATPLAKKVAGESNVNLGEVTGTGPHGRIQSSDVEEFLRRLELRPKVTPAAAVVAEQKGVDTALVRPSGERIRRADVERYVDSIDVIEAEEPVKGENSTPGGRLVPHSSMRKAIAKRMTESWTMIPHVSLHRTVSVNGMVDLQQRASAHQTKKVSLTAVIACLVSRILPKYSFLNGYYETTGCRVFDDVHLGIAVSVPNGLLVPVIRNANLKSILEIADEIAELSERARFGSLQPDELEGGTFTLSSLGMYGIDGFTPIIVPPQTGILGIGRTVQVGHTVGAGIEGATQTTTNMTISLSFDHRAVDGVYGAQFLESLAQCFADPLRLLM